jgi:fatty-acyl-CoA synthase
VERPAEGRDHIPRTAVSSSGLPRSQHGQRMVNAIWNALLDSAHGGVGGFRHIDSHGNVHLLDLESLVRDAESVAAALYGTDIDDRVVVAAPNGLDFIRGFFGAIRAGRVPVPAPWGATPSQVYRLSSMLKDVGSTTLLTTSRCGNLSFAAEELGARLMLIDQVERANAPPFPRWKDTCFIQYTSGSIARPKPVSVSCANVLAIAQQASEIYGDGVDSTAVTWVPLFHDMGLVTAILRPIVGGYPSVILEPEHFVRRPSCWLEAIGAFRATHTSAPNFGYALCARKCADDLEGLDLSSLRVARVAGEHVSGETMRAFSSTFAKAGFDERAVCASYGLAEATLTVTSRRPGEGMASVYAARDSLRGGTFVKALAPSGAVELVSLGRPMPGTSITILDEMGQPLPDGRVGEVEIVGPQVAAPADGAQEEMCTGDSRMLSGDFGFTHEGELFLVGRNSERFSIHGLTYYAFDIETIASAASSFIREGRVAAVMAAGGASVVIAAELVTGAGVRDYESICFALRRAVTHRTGITVSQILLVARGSLERTSSGKLRRPSIEESISEGKMPYLYVWQSANTGGGSRGDHRGPSGVRR